MSCKDSNRLGAVEGFLGLKFMHFVTHTNTVYLRYNISDNTLSSDHTVHWIYHGSSLSHFVGT
jgi:hypothetical protein